MSLYEKYTAGYEGTPYVVGREDCYGLVRRWMKDKYGLKLTNYARPFMFDDSGLPLLTDHFQAEGFQIVSVPFNRLDIGDLLLMRLANRSGHANHIGVYVGNGYLLHHLFNQKSVADPLTDRWTGRVLDVIRHPEITQKNLEQMERVDMMTYLPPHLRAKYERITAGTVESAG
jgi:cell wall-associated NlpC family hydrolase